MKFSKKNLVAIGIILLLIAGIVFVIVKNNKPEIEKPPVEVIVEKTDPEYKIVGQSVEGRNIESFTFNRKSENASVSQKNILFVGGIHGGYEWNSVLLSYQMIDYLKSNPEFIPADVSVTIVPSANPDGLFKFIGKEGRFDLVDVPLEANTTGIGRFNANNVDLNRNFDCKWKPQSTWRSNVVSAGTSAFSEPEAVAIRNVVSAEKPSAVIFWHSQASAVYASECENGILPVTRDIMNAYALASGYTPVDVFDAYEITGDAEGWLASIGIPAITVELKTRNTTEWNVNLAGVKSVIEYFSLVK